MRGTLGIAAAVLSVLLSSARSYGAEFSIVEKRVLSENDVTSNPVCNVRLSGPIVPGDAERMISTLKALAVEMSGNEFLWGYTLCLNSPGGSYEAGLEVVRAVLDNRIATMVEGHADCYSVCALIFMSGNMQYEGSLLHKRYLNLLGRLGFHAPYLAGVPEGKYSSANIGQTFEQGIRATGNLLKLGKEHKLEILPMDVLTEMLQKGPEDVFPIDTVFKAILAQVDLYADGGISPKIDRTALCYACQDVFIDTRRFGIDNPPNVCTALSVQVKKGATWFGGFGAEGNAFCVAKTPGPYGASFGVYQELVYDTGKSLDASAFIRSSPWYAMLPSTHIGY